MFRAVRTVFNPFTRTAVLAFAWTHRRQIMRWGRSFWTELRRPGRIAPRRLATIARVLWSITTDDAIANAKQLREVRLDGDVLVVDAAPGWRKLPHLVGVLHDVPGISRIVDADGRLLVGSTDAAA